MLESTYQNALIRKIRDLYPGCVVLKNDPAYIQGIPDLTVFNQDRWATLEVKTSARAKTQPNQEYYVDLMNDMSFSSFIYPGNEDEVFDGLQYALTHRR